MKRVYYHKWFPRFFYKKPDGGLESGVTSYFLIEWKPFCKTCGKGLKNARKAPEDNEK